MAEIDEWRVMIGYREFGSVHVGVDVGVGVVYVTDVDQDEQKREH
jgi:hypothetical protein